MIPWISWLKLQHRFFNGWVKSCWSLKEEKERKSLLLFFKNEMRRRNEFWTLLFNAAVSTRGSVRACVWVCGCECVCVCERERERDRERGVSQSEWQSDWTSSGNSFKLSKINHSYFFHLIRQETTVFQISMLFLFIFVTWIFFFYFFASKGGLKGGESHRRSKSKSKSKRQQLKVPPLSYLASKIRRLRRGKRK